MEYMRTLYLDLDGVLADFDRSACKMLGTTNSYKFEFVYGQDMFWERLNRDPHFFRNLELMPDAMILWDAVKHMNLAILTALPSSRAAQVDEQKREWVARHFGANVPVITCRTEDKPNYCRPGDILVDDRAVNRARWAQLGGYFVVHTSATDTINSLSLIGAIRG